MLLLLLSLFASVGGFCSAEQTFSWKFESAVSVLPSCGSVSISLENVTNVQPPLYMLSFLEDGDGIASKTMLLGPANDLLWVVDHSPGSSIVLTVVDSQGHSGGPVTEPFMVSPGASSECLPMPTNTGACQSIALDCVTSPQQTSKFFPVSFFLSSSSFSIHWTRRTIIIVAASTSGAVLLIISICIVGVTCIRKKRKNASAKAAMVQTKPFNSPHLTFSTVEDAQSANSHGTTSNRLRRPRRPRLSIVSWVAGAVSPYPSSPSPAGSDRTSKVRFSMLHGRADPVAVVNDDIGSPGPETIKHTGYARGEKFHLPTFTLNPNRWSKRSIEG
ncbi:hypothetical protein C8J56DRAFT_280884 [Mycena floridula]|nr:hypothetical protein C8J56DRAFT_280884 [Mycena floridula]